MKIYKEFDKSTITITPNTTSHKYTNTLITTNS